MRFVCLLALGIVGTAQEPPQFKVDVSLVTVAATVRNAGGALVGDLDKEDFEILEDGVVQPIRVFNRRSDLPLNLGLILDVSGSQGKFLKRHRRDLATFLDSVIQKRDQVFLVCFGNRLRLVSDFTNSGDDLLDRLDEFEDGKRRFPLLGPEEERVLGTALFDSIFFSIQEQFRRVETGRRAILVFSDGEENSSGHDLLDAIEAAQNADVLVYGIRYIDGEAKRQTVRNRYGMSVLKHVSEHTGGTDFDAMKRGMKESFRAIGEELRSIYEIGYVSNNRERDGTFRKIRMRVKRDGMTARSRPGYYAR